MAHNGLLQSLLVLESYRTVLLQVPARMPASLIRLIVADCGLSSCSLWQLPYALSHWSGRNRGLQAITEGNLTALSLMALIVPPCAPDAEASDSGDAASASLTDYVHATFHGLGAGRDFSISELLMYHMMNISLHVSLDLLQCFTRSTSGECMEASKDLVTNRVKKWHSSKHGIVACWHATRIMTGTQEELHKQVKTQERTVTRPESMDATETPLLSAPHVSYSIYYASIVLWSAATISGSAKVERDQHLKTGSKLLRSLPVRVASTLANALSEIPG